MSLFTYKPTHIHVYKHDYHTYIEMSNYDISILILVLHDLTSFEVSIMISTYQLSDVCVYMFKCLLYSDHN